MNDQKFLLTLYFELSESSSASNEDRLAHIDFSQLIIGRIVTNTVEFLSRENICELYILNGENDTGRNKDCGIRANLANV